LTSATTASAALTARYATALIELAHDSGKIEAVERDLNQISSMLKDSADFAAFVRSPLSGRVAQLKAITAIAEKAGFDGLTKNFLGVLAQNNRLNVLKQVIEATCQEIATRRGEVTVQVQTAQDLTPAQLKNLQEILSKNMNRTVTIRAKVEPSLMGGMIVTVGSQMIDDSVRRKLERLKMAMGQQANQNLTNNAEEVG
jgi:F-type H+-transporting ATPase subunit delta